MNLQEINDLIRKYVDGTASKADIEALNRWYREKAHQDAEFPEDEDAVGEAMLARLNQETKAAKTKPIYRWVAAASAVLILGVAGVFVTRMLTTDHANFLHQNTQSNILPGGNKAILTLANGSKISLTDAGNGQIANQNGIKVTKAANGQLVYTITDRKDLSGAASSTDLDASNTIETPKGGQYQVVLPDGSRVWLNAYSSLKFPVSFANRNERRVELSGEAYFEVSHNKEMPFRVITNRQTVEVLGTHFNVNAYADDATTKTTLLQGMVRVTAANRSAILNPGQQAKLGNTLDVSEVNTEEAVAWKNGYFNFDDEKLENIMRSVSRWYNVDVVFADQSLRNETFGAVTTRFASINTLLKMIEQTGDARFSIQGSTITISKKK
ncbi:FecR family protein [Mucilaginibacter rubeus]|uniref:FecR family protein n=1 Tax=Mucilaginibacter rubeus TaxID=2027860 RepID=UPI00166C180D|nr:FecR domain-containing protein [Mucilaginibacter rubeus]GGA96343.1 iron dicitrate transporter FecR [Mucilaginibacter rubeus]